MTARRGQAGRRAKAELAARLEETLNALAEGRLAVKGEGHDTESTRRRLQLRLDDLVEDKEGEER